MNTRQQILKATERVILSKGLARVTTKEIARAAGYAEGTLYKHFETKEDLFLAVVQENLPDFVETVREDRAGKDTVQTNLEEIAHATINYYGKLMPLLIALFADSDLLTRHREWMQIQNTGPMRIYERVAEYIRAEQNLGRINKQRNAVFTAALLLGPCFQYVFMRSFTGTEPSPITQEGLVTELVQTLISGVLPVDQ